MPEDFVIARNPEPDSTLPYLIRIPLPGRPVVLKARDTWPRTTKVYCHRAESWPEVVDVVERVPTRSCVRRGAAIELVLDRGRENRSQLVFTYVRGREAIFWQTARTAKQARPAVRVPTARAAGHARFSVLVDTHERYPYRFAGQQVDVVRRALPAGDYGVELDGEIVASVERKSLADLVTGVTTGKLRYQLGDLAALPRAAVVVEDRWSAVFALEHVRPAVVADALTEVQVRWPSVPIVFTETRKLAEEWVYRWLAAALQLAEDESGAQRRVAELAAAGRLPAVRPSIATIRAWALAAGLPVSDRGRLRPEIVEAYDAAHRPARTGETPASDDEEGQHESGSAPGAGPL
ncbi:MAG: Lsr2 family protein [Actinomycetota bacterium]|nr:Lsr2 family protein [Actinomycetota bacterium]